MLHLEGQALVAQFEGKLFHADSICPWSNADQLRVHVSTLASDILIRNENEPAYPTRHICRIFYHVV